jgi:flagellar biosynthesis protein FliR
VIDVTGFPAPLAVLFCRIGGCLLTIPGLSTARVAPQIRVLLALALTVALGPIVLPEVDGLQSGSLPDFVRLIVLETIIGVALGLAARMYMLALGFGASAIGASIGFQGLNSVGIDEAEPQAALVTFVTIAALTVMFLMDFHHSVIRGLIESYNVLPVSANPSAVGLLTNLADTLTDSFLVVLGLSSPFIAYALLVNLLFGLLNKLTPQIPVYFVSMPFVIFGGLLLAFFVLPAVLSLFVQGFFELRMLR